MFQAVLRFSEIDLNANGELDCLEIRAWKEGSLKSGSSVSCDKVISSVFNGSDGLVQRIDDGDGDRKVDLKEFDETVKDVNQENAMKLLEFIKLLLPAHQEVNKEGTRKPKITTPSKTKLENAETPKDAKITGTTKTPNKTPGITKP